MPSMFYGTLLFLVLIVMSRSMNFEGANYNDFLQALPTDEPRYGVYDLPDESADGSPSVKIFLVNW